MTTQSWPDCRFFRWQDLRLCNMLRVGLTRLRPTEQMNMMEQTVWLFQWSKMLLRMLKKQVCFWWKVQVPMVPMAHSFAEKPKSSRLKVGVPAVQVPRKKCDSVFCGCEICVEKSGEFSVPLKTHAVCDGQPDFLQVRTTVHQGSLEIHIFPWVRVSFLASKKLGDGSRESKGPTTPTLPPNVTFPPANKIFLGGIRSHHIVPYLGRQFFFGWAR